MPERSDPRRLARRRLAALLHFVPLALEGLPEGVHQARVASRRLRELLPLFAVTPELDAAVRKQRARVRRLTRGLGAVRELDVARFTLDDLVGERPAEAEAAEVVRGTLAAARPKAVAHMRAAAASLSLDRLAHRLRGVAGEVAPPARRAQAAAVLAARLADRGQMLRAAVEEAGTVYAPARLHRVRIALKKYRYVLELARDFSRLRLRGSLARLKRLQDLLGTLHDYEVLAARVRDCGADETDPDRQAALTALARHLDEAIRHLHSEFLTEREALTVVFFWARRVRLRLAPPPVRRRRSRASRRGGSTSTNGLEAAS
jgi:CHAD domain-containing protein